MTLARLHKDRPYYADDLGLDAYNHVLRGVYIGGCVDERNAWSVWEDNYGHAHNSKNSEWRGWICIWKPELVLTPTGRHSMLLLHELAHLLAPDKGHTHAWKVAVTELGAGGEVARCKLKPLKGSL